MRGLRVVAVLKRKGPLVSLNSGVNGRWRGEDCFPINIHSRRRVGDRDDLPIESLQLRIHQVPSRSTIELMSVPGKSSCPIFAGGCTRSVSDASVSFADCSAPP